MAGKETGWRAEKEAYSALAKQNLRELKALAEQLEDFELLKALATRICPKLETIEALWDAYKEIAEGDKTEVSTDKRANLTSRYRENRKRWKQLSQWEKKKPGFENMLASMPKSGKCSNGISLKV